MKDIQRRAIARKFAPLTLVERADGAPPLIRGYAAVFYREGDPGTEFQLWPGVKERIMRSAFDSALKPVEDGGDDPRALFDHDSARILGRRSAGTLRLGTDERGLWYEIDPPETQTARDLIESIRRGDVTGSSFAFVPRLTNYREEAPAEEGGRRLTYVEQTDVALYDVGPVTFPAYAGSEAGLRSDAADLDAIRADLDRRDVSRVLAALEIVDWDEEEGE